MTHSPPPQKSTRYRQNFLGDTAFYSIFEQTGSQGLHSSVHELCAQPDYLPLQDLRQLFPKAPGQKVVQSARFLQGKPDAFQHAEVLFRGFRRLPGVLGGEYVNHPVAIVGIVLPILGIYVDFLKQSAEANLRNPAAGFFQNFPAQAVLRRLPGAVRPREGRNRSRFRPPGRICSKVRALPGNQRLVADADDHARFSIRSIFSAHFSMVSASKAG